MLMSLLTTLKALLMAALIASDLPVTDLPVTVGRVLTGPNSRVELTNTADQPVTAWALAMTTHPDVGRTHREVWTVDGYLADATRGLPGAPAQLEPLRPHETRQLPIDPLPTDATVTVIAVVLDDGFAEGEEPVLASIFERRARERDALEQVVHAFNDVFATARGPAALTALRDRLTALVQRDSSVPCRAALDAVETYERRASASADDIDRSIRTYLALVTQEYELAAKHAQRKSRKGAFDDQVGSRRHDSESGVLHAGHVTR
jgi:signal transduction histidine kinase